MFFCPPYKWKAEQINKLVFIKIFAIELTSSNDPIASCEPPLNPNQPSHNINVPKVAKGIDEAAYGSRGATWPFLNLFSLGPKIIAPAWPERPPPLTEHLTS